MTTPQLHHRVGHHRAALQDLALHAEKSNGMVERFNDRVQREVLGITIYCYRDLETVLRGFNAAYNRRR